MLYSEFLEGTRAPETPDTYNQFQIIGQIYEDYEVRCFYKGKAHNLGIYKDVGVANEHATDFRNLGPDGYLTKYGKWGTV